MSGSETGDAAALFRMTMKLMDLWNLDPEQRAAVLGGGMSTSPVDSRADALQLMTGTQLNRFTQLLGIHERLRLLFPQNPELAYRWMTSSNKAFEDLTPVDVISKSGVSGLIQLRAYLDGYLALRTR